MTESEAKRKVTEAVKAVVELGNEEFPAINFNELTIKFTLWGSRTMGKANWNERTLWFHPEVARRNVERYIDEVVIHEVAHLYQYKLYPGSRPHGLEFYMIARKLGDSGKRCSTGLDTTGLGRTKTRYIYECPTCGRNSKFTKRQHETQQTLKNSRYGFYCRNDSTKFVYTNEVIKFK